MVAAADVVQPWGDEGGGPLALERAAAERAEVAEQEPRRRRRHGPRRRRPGLLLLLLLPRGRDRHGHRRAGPVQGPRLHAHRRRALLAGRRRPRGRRRRRGLLQPGLIVAAVGAGEPLHERHELVGLHVDHLRGHHVDDHRLPILRCRRCRRRRLADLPRRGVHAEAAVAPDVIGVVARGGHGWNEPKVRKDRCGWIATRAVFIDG